MTTFIRKILKLVGLTDTAAGEEAKDNDSDLNGTEHLRIYGKVIKKNRRMITVQKEGAENGHIDFNLDNVESEFIPLPGDSVILDCLVPDTAEDVFSHLCITKISPKQTAFKSGIVTDWDHFNGIVSNFAQFNIHDCEPGYQPTKGDRVLYSLIHSDQPTFSWRAIRVMRRNRQPDARLSKQRAEALKEQTKDKEGVFITRCARIELQQGTKKTVIVEVVNKSNTVKSLENCFRVTPSNLSQMNLISPVQHENEIQPDGIVLYKFSIEGKYLGRSSEHYVWHFKGFQIARVFELQVTDPSIVETDGDQKIAPQPRKDDTASQLIDRSSGVIMPGRRSFAPAAFVPVKLDQFPLPDRVLKAALPEEEMSLDDLMIRVEDVMPILKEQLKWNNYTKRMHSLLYLEEVAMLKQVKHRDILNRTSLRREHQAVNLAVKHLGHAWLFPQAIKLKPPQVIVEEIEERVKQKEVDGSNAKKILNRDGLMIRKKMLNRVELEQGQLRVKGKQGIGYGIHCTIDNETKVNIAVEQKKKIKWFNKGLNMQQKEAVRNVLLGEARPLPYIIFGAPGTGKTVTVVETILQLHALIPESRLLVATPSNSAADLIATRLLESGDLEQGDLLRMVGYHYLEQGRIAASIVPYSAVPDLKAINIEGPSGNCHKGVQMCGREQLAMHRVTVGTLRCLGLLYNMGLPRGHFTHVIVDEAGQATEPEVLIPMVFLHMDYGQVVLAGDPLQLGPVVTSRLASRGGLSQSLLARLIGRFPYTRDPAGFPDSSGYDPRLVTKLIPQAVLHIRSRSGEQLN